MQTIELTQGPAGTSVHNEALSAAGSAIVPGDVIEEVAAGTVQEHSTAAGNAQKLVALTAVTVGGDVDRVYAVGETVRYGAFHAGQEVWLRVAAGATAIPLGGVLESAADGTVRIQSAGAATSNAQRVSVFAYAREAVDNSGGASVVRIKGRVA